MAVDFLSKLNSDGTALAQSSSDKFAIVGSSPAVQLSGPQQIAIVRGQPAGVVATFGTTQTPAGVAATSTLAASLTVQSGGSPTLVPATGDFLLVNKPTAQAGLAIGNVRLSASNVAGVAFANITGAIITPTAGEKYNVTAIRGLPVLTASLTPAIVASNTTAEQIFTVTGVRVGDVVAVSKAADQTGLVILGARVAAANQVGINFANVTPTAITPTAAETYSVLCVGGLDAVNNDLYVGLNVGTLGNVVSSTIAFQSVTMTGLATSDVVRGIMKPTAQTGLGSYGGFVSGANGLGLALVNASAALITPTASEVYGISLYRPNPTAPCVTYSVALSPAAVASLTSAEQGFTVTGLISNSLVVVNKPSAQAGLGIGGARVSGTSALAIVFTNTSVTAITPTAAETYSVANFQMPIGDAGSAWVQSAMPVQQNLSILANAMRAALVNHNFIPGA